MAKSSKMLEDMKKLLVEGTAATQEGIKQHLINLGYEVNQAKISRLLRKLGAVKTSNEYGHVVYLMPKEPALPQAKSLLSNLIIDINANESLIVIHTSPGSASLFGRLIDHNMVKLKVLGTVAGDDTLIVIPKSVKHLAQTLSDIQELLAQL
ncbi:MAG: ArgR family transcriptional regulator [Gammaproteobacteria bacterium]|nr:ArgR family transcriptional regulator [Gammaproteobacteria bacterium]